MDSVQDSNGFYRTLPPFSHLLAKIGDFSPLLENTTDSVSLVFSGAPASPSLLLIARGDIEIPAALKDRFLVTEKNSFLVFRSAADTMNTAVIDAATREELKRQSRGLSGETTTHILMRPQKVIGLLQDEVTVNLLAILLKEFTTSEWTAFDVSANGQLFTLSGIANTEGDQSNRPGNRGLFRYVPSNASLAVLSATDTLSYVLFNCNYGLPSENADDNTFIVLQAHDTLRPGFESAVPYRGIPIARAKLQCALPFQPAWAGESTVAALGEVQVFARDAQRLKLLIDNYLGNDQLQSTPVFNSMRHAISDAGFTLIVQPGEIDSANPFLRAHPSRYSGINALVLQSLSELPGQTFYSMAALHHSKTADELPVMWAVTLDALPAAGPWLFTNHYTSEPELLVLDAAHDLYLISAQGKTLWKKPLGEAIEGNVQQIDAFGSGKYQLLFATAGKLHLVDRNGQDVEGFPVTLEHRASAEPYAVRYDNKGDYRILVADGLVLKNFESTGGAVQGWKNPTLSDTLTAPVKVITREGKDYVIAQCKNGTVHFMDRKGEKRHKDLQLPPGHVSRHFIEGRSFNDCRFVAADSLGNLHVYHADGKSETHKVLLPGQDAGFSVLNLGRPFYFSITQDRLLCLDEKLNTVLDRPAPGVVLPTLHNVSAKKKWIALNARENNSIYVIDLEGKMLEHMPVTGVGKCLAKDLDGNGKEELVAAHPEGRLVVYRLED